MLAHISTDDQRDAISLTIFTEENRLKYTIMIPKPDRISIIYVLRDLGITKIGFDQNLPEDWYKALAFLYNEFEAN